MYIAPGQGQTTPWGQNLDVNRNSLLLCPFVASLKKISLKSDFLLFFPPVYSPRQGRTTHWGQKFYDNRNAFSLCPYVASFKMISSKSDFIHIFNDFIHVYNPRARAENLLGTNFWCKQKALITSTICCKFQMSLILYIAPGAGADMPLWAKFWCQQKCLVTFAFFFIHVYSPGAATDNPLGSEFLFYHKPFVTLVICCKFLSLNDFLTVFPHIKA